MRYDIGSIFSISDYECHEIVSENNRWGKDYFSLCREAIYMIATRYENTAKRVMLPAYTCQTVIDPFLQRNWNFIFYDIRKDLHIDEISFQEAEKSNPNIILFHPFYGMDLNESEVFLFEEAKKRDFIIVEDLTQCIFSEKKYSFVDYYVGSLRKWFELPDGGFLIQNEKNIEVPSMSSNKEFVSAQLDAMYLRGEYFKTGDVKIKEISRRINKYAVDLVTNNKIIPHAIAQYSSCKIKESSFEMNKRKRYENYRFLLENLPFGGEIQAVNSEIERVTTAPLYFPIYAKNRKKIQQILAQNQVYAPILWPIVESEVLLSETTRYIYEHILVIPCDQRYSVDDMMYIVEILKNEEK